MANSKFFKNKPISIPIQKYNIRKYFKEMIVKDFPGMGIKMLVRIQPTEISKYYEVLLTYESIEKRPQAYISISQLGIDDKKSIPHTYGIKNINYNYNYKTEDVAKIKKLEIDKEIKLKEMQSREKRIY